MPNCTKNRTKLPVNQSQQKKIKLDQLETMKKLKTEGVDSKQLEEVKMRINTGYYNSLEVIEKVVDEIIKEID